MEIIMDEEKLNISTRKLLKNVGINSQRIIESSVRKSIEDGNIDSSKKIKVCVKLEIESLGINEQMEGEIDVDI